MKQITEYVLFVVIFLLFCGIFSEKERIENLEKTAKIQINKESNYKDTIRNLRDAIKTEDAIIKTLRKK